MRYGNPEGVARIIVNVDKNGILGFDIRSAPDHSYMNASGVDMFSSTIQRLNQEGIQVNKIRGRGFQEPIVLIQHNILLT